MPKPVQKHFCFSTSWVRRKVTTITRLWQFFRPPIDGVSGHFQSFTMDVSKDLQNFSDAGSLPADSSILTPAHCILLAFPSG